jgi:uncharacterized protein CbrC (UPF0167 family)
MNNNNNGYADVRMNLNEVCNWLIVYGHNELAEVMRDSFKYHTFTVEGMIRKDVVKDIITKAFGEDGFRIMECDITTHMKFIPIHEAHVD